MKTVVGIDPDHEKSGVAEFDCALHRYMRVETYTFSEMLQYLEALSRVGDVLIVVEASWRIGHNWHLGGNYGNSARAAAIGRSVGMNHQTGMDIVSAAKYFGLTVQEQMPFRKCWSGADGKITAKEIELITGYGKTTNQEKRDAMLIAWVVAGEPIRVRK